MAAVKLLKFLGEAPKISSELLPDGAAQLAYNTKLYSGDLLPYRLPLFVSNLNRIGEVKTIHALKNPSTGAINWLSWMTDVDIVTASSSEDQEQRFYYTGDGVPKVSNYALSITGAEPYPNGYYELGLPLPTTKVTTSAASAPNATTSTYARDSGNTATIVTGSAHGLRTGNIVTVSGFTSAVGKIFNATNVTATVTNSTTFTYYSPGDAVTSTSDTSGKVALAGNTQIRSYVYTWYTPWDEESIGSDPSENLYIKEGQTVTVTNLPTAKPAGSNTFIRGVKLYRTVPSAAGTQYFLLKTLWFPTTLARVQRTSNVSRVTLSNHHNLAIDDRFKISGCTDSTFNITGGIVTDVIDDTTFEYAQTAGNVADKAETAGTMYQDAAQKITDTARYWGDGSYSFTDDFDISLLNESLITDNYDPPPENMKGITAVQNSILIGFFDNQLCFSELGKPHAWPQEYRLTFESTIVGVASVGGFILVLTEEYPYQVSGGDPATMATARIDTLFPCLSKRSIVNMGYGVSYVTHGGVAIYSPSTGIDLLTKYVHDWDTWGASLDTTTVIAKYYNGKYFASHSTDSFIFERDERIGGFFVSINYKFSAAYNDPETNKFYYVGDTLGNLYEWDADTQPLASLEWKSKTVVTKDYLNLGAARVIADYATPDAEAEAIAAYNAGVPAYNAQVWLDYSNPVATVSYARASNVATIVTAAAHGMITGSKVDVSGFTGGAASTFNTQQTVVTVVNATTFTYANVGTTITTTADATGTVSSLKGLGDMNGPYDRVTSGGIRIETSGALNSTVVNGDNFTRTYKTVAGVLPVTFRLWANKVLIFQGTVFNSDIFRLPSGYRSDTFEMAVSGSARVRAIHIGETPFGLRAS